MRGRNDGKKWENFSLIGVGIIKSFLIAIQFLTIIPIRVNASSGEIARNVAAFPLAGLFIGLILAFSAYFLSMAFDPDIVSAVVLLLYVIITGAFHLDGLSDTFDALAKRGSREEKLMAMKDGASGPAGVAAIVFSVLIKYVLIKSLLKTPYIGLFLIAMLPVLSRWAMAVTLHHGRPARPEGLGKLLMEGATTARTLTATATTAAFLFTPLFYMKGVSGLVFSVIAMISIYVFVYFLGRFFDKHFGGVSGDTAGAAGELSEIFYLFGASIWLKNFS